MRTLKLFVGLMMPVCNQIKIVSSDFYSPVLCIQGCLSLSTIKSAFQENGHKLSARDCKAMAVSALRG